jgi:hypothetical protein
MFLKGFAKFLENQLQLPWVSSTINTAWVVNRDSVTHIAARWLSPARLRPVALCGYGATNLKFADTCLGVTDLNLRLVGIREV